MINSGWHFLRFVKVSTARVSNVDPNSDWLYRFTADTLKGEHLDFFFKVSNKGELSGIVADLVLMSKGKKWWNVHLIENSNRMLMIQSIKEPVETQEELNEKSRLARLSVQ